MTQKTLAAFLFFIAAAAAVAQDVKTTPQPKPTLREITVESIFDPKQRVAFSGAPQSGFIWLDDKTFAWPRTDEKGEVVEQTVVDTETGKKRVLFDAAKLEAAAKKIAGVSNEEAKRLTTQRNWNFSPNKKSVLLTIANDLYLYTFDSDSMTRLTSAPGAEEEASFSPDGRFVSFVRDNNLYVVDVATQRERQLTTDGSETRSMASWIGSIRKRSTAAETSARTGGAPTPRASPSCSSTSGRCKRFAVVDHIPYQQNVESELYPKAGAPNPVARLFTRRRLGRHAARGQHWRATPAATSSSSTSTGRRTERSSSTRSRTASRPGSTSTSADARRQCAEDALPRDDQGVGRARAAIPVWLKDGSFLWLSERSGFKHLYHYGADGALIEQLTNGQWEVRDAPRRRRREPMGLFRGHGTLAHRRRRLSHQARRQRHEAAVRCAGTALREVQSVR